MKNFILELAVMAFFGVLFGCMFAFNF